MPAGGLSQGERKLLDVAVAYALRPKLLFLDEPTSGVSTREKAPIMDIITAVVRSGGITAVIIEHDMDVVFTYCPRIVAMHQGAILADGTPGRDPEQRAGDGQPARRPDRLTAMLELERLNTFRGPAQVLRDLSLTVGGRASRCAWSGATARARPRPSTASWACCPSRSGTVAFDGRDITRLPTHQRALAGIGYSPEDAGIFPDLTVAENFQISQSLARAAGKGAPRSRATASTSGSSRSSPRSRLHRAGAGSSSPAARRRWWPSPGP